MSSPSLALLRPLNDRIIVRRLDDHSEAMTTAAGTFAVVRPHKDALVVLAEPEKEVSHGQIVEYEKMSHRGEVVAVGPGKWIVCKSCNKQAPIRRPMSLKPGDIVHFGRFVDLQDDGLCIMQEDDILGME